MTIPTNKLGNIDALDGLRGFACLLVVFSHVTAMGMPLHMKGAGQFGVMLFFSLSGFLMSYLYGDSRPGFKTWGQFGVVRIFRVYPLFLAVVIASYVIIRYQLFAFPYNMTLDQLQKHVLLQGQLSILWTIPVEMKFYLLFPVIATILWNFPKRWYRFAIALALFVASLVFDIDGGKTDLWPYLKFFLGGMCAGYAYDSLSALPCQYRSVVWNSLFVFSLAAIVLAIPQVFRSLFGYMHQYWEDGVYFAPLMALTVISCALSNGPLRLPFSNPASRFIGKISYSLYLLHLPVLVAIRVNYNDAPVTGLLLGLLLSVLVAWAAFLAIEQPIRRLGKHLINPDN